MTTKLDDIRRELVALKRSIDPHISDPRRYELLRNDFNPIWGRLEVLLHADETQQSASKQCGIEFTLEGESYRCSLKLGHTGQHGRIEVLRSPVAASDLLPFGGMRIGNNGQYVYGMDLDAALKEIERMRPMAESWESYEAAQERKGSADETSAPLTPIEALLVEWWDSNMENAELFNRAVRLSQPLAKAMTALVEKAPQETTALRDDGSTGDLLLARNALSNLLAAAIRTQQLSTGSSFKYPDLEFAIGEARKLLGGPFAECSCPGGSLGVYERCPIHGSVKA